MLADALKSEIISPDEEASLIELARERVGYAGASVPTSAAMDARERLISAYMPAVSAAVRRSKVRSKEDLESDLVERLLSLIASHDSSKGRLASRISTEFAHVTRESAAAEAAFSVPSSTRDRFYNILFAQAGGDIYKALRLADEHPHMTRDSFLALARALVGVESTSVNAEGDGHLDYASAELIGTRLDPSLDSERADLVVWLLDRLDEGTRLIIELAYGFVSEELEKIRLEAGYQYDETLDDAQIAALSASPVHHRVSVNRRRNAGLRIMRQALELEES